MKTSISIILFTLFALASYAQVDELCRKSTEGTDFWFGFMESRNAHEKHYVEITVTARETSDFTIGIGPNETPFGGTYTVNANSSVQIRIPWNMVEAIGSELIEDKGIHVISEKPVNVYALNWDTNSADVAVIYPVESLGKEHFAMCYYPDIDLNNPVTGNGKNSEFLIVAVHDSTRIEITPSKVTHKLFPKDSTMIVFLNKGQVFQIQSENEVGTSAQGQGDLTGSHIISNKPLAFFSGSHSTRVPVGECCWDHLYEQIPPIQAWGREYYVVPLQTRQSDRYRIIAAKDNTIIQINGRPDIVLNRGEFKELVFSYTEPKKIFADKPIMVAQYSQSRNVDREFTGGNGDPFMIILSSISQSKNDVTFVAYQSDQIKKYFVNIVTLTSEIPNMRYKGQPIGGFTPFPVGDYSFVQKEIGTGTHRIQNIDPKKGFLAYVYGYGGVESYGYGVGFNLDLVLDLGESINFNGDTLLLCYGDTRTLDAGAYFDTYDWNTGDTTQTLDVINGGKYYVKTATIDGCVLEDSIFIYMSKPQTELGIEYDQGCAPYSIELDAKGGFQKYIWQNEFGDTLSTNQKIIANTTAEYRISAFNELNCPARDTMKLVVFPVPDVELNGENLLCGSKTSSVSATITGTPDSVWNYPGSFQWKTNNPALTFSDSTHTNTTINVADWGDYDIYYELTTIDGCTSGDTLQVRFHPIPTSDFAFVENPEDKCKGYHREVQYTGNTSQDANFYWDFGGSKVTKLYEWDHFAISIGAYNSNPFISLHIEDKGCYSDTTRKAIGANPDFKLETGKARGCDSMSVDFKGTLNVEDQLLFQWDFGDGSPVENKQNVQHFYGKTGFYDVSLTITNLLNGCKVGYEIDSMIKVFPTPIAHITADPTFCYPDSAELIYTNSIDSSVCMWSFNGAHQTGSGNDTIQVLIEDPTANVQLIVDEYGCVSEPVETQLKRKPKFDFSTVDEEGCQPYELEIEAEPFDLNLAFEWITDSLPYPKGESARYFYPDSGKFDITLKANSTETGCLDTLTKKEWIWVHPKPFAKYEPDYPVALLEHANLSFFNYSERATQYLWEFGDGEISNEFEPMHEYTELGEFNSQLFIESEFTCKDTFDFLITILPFNVHTPNAFRPNSDIPENRTFMPVGTGADLSRFNFKVFDRWGQVVFESKTPENPWDGKLKNGEPAPMGNYIWMANYFDIQDFEHKPKGQVLLIR